MNKKRSAIKVRCCVTGCIRTKESDDERCLYHIRAHYGVWLNKSNLINVPEGFDINEEYSV